MLSQRDQARQLGENVATNQFAAFLNPSNRGVNFKWSTFDQWVRAQARQAVALQIPHQDKNRKQLCDLAEEFASRQLKWLMDESGVKDPVPMSLETLEEGRNILDQLVDQVSTSVHDEGLLREALREVLSDVWKAGNESGQPDYPWDKYPELNPFRGPHE